MKKRKKSVFHKNLESMTYDRIMSMTILDSELKIRFLHDVNDTKCYVIFDGRNNSTYYAKSYQMAEKRYNYLVKDNKTNGNAPIR